MQPLLSMSEATAHPRDELADSELSPARQAAEAAFAQRHHASREAPLVVVKRRRLIGEATERDSSSGPARVTDDARKARVFRVDSVLVVQDQQDSPSQAQPEDPNLPAVAAGDSMRTSATRPRRRTPHGKVTVIRPEPPPAIPRSTPRAPEALSGSSGRRAGGPHPPILDVGAVARYEAVMADIEVLKRQAAKLRKAEAVRAVRWIREAMADYGITVRDLGL